MRSFDTFVAVEGFPINSLYDLKRIIKGYKEGQMVTVIYIRDSHFRIMEYELGAIKFDEYLDFYDKKMEDRFDKKVPQEEKKKQPPPHKRLPPQLEKPQEKEDSD